MSHALIIDDNVAISRAVRARLAACGFDSFDRSWTRQQAVDAARARRSDLIVMGVSICGGSPLAVAREIAAGSEAPILTTTRDRGSLKRPLAAEGVLEGPYSLDEFDDALASAHSRKQAVRGRAEA